MNLGCINTPSSNHPFLLIFKNMSLETMVQICHITQPKFMKFLPGIGITPGLLLIHQQILEEFFSS